MDATKAACPGTSLPTTSVDAVKQTMFAEANPSGITVGSTYNQCSYGKTRLTAANSMVADIVQLPCSGNT